MYIQNSFLHACTYSEEFYTYKSLFGGFKKLAIRSLKGGKTLTLLNRKETVLKCYLGSWTENSAQLSLKNVFKVLVIYMHYKEPTYKIYIFTCWRTFFLYAIICCPRQWQHFACIAFITVRASSSDAIWNEFKQPFSHWQSLLSIDFSHFWF